jgi:hypothetical protein
LKTDAKHVSILTKPSGQLPAQKRFFSVHRDWLVSSTAVIGIMLVAALLLLGLAIYIALRSKTAAFEDRKKKRRTELHAEAVSRYPDDEAFDAVFEKHIASKTDKFFNAKITGVWLPNADGSDRISIIKKCEPMELLRLDVEPNNPVDPKAIAVTRVDGSQLGYLDFRVACDLHRDAGKPVSWSAVFRHADLLPETDEVIGAVIVLTRSKLDEPDTN